MSIATTFQAIVAAVPPSLLNELGVTEAAIVSPRTIKFNLKTPAPDGTNQIKVTVEAGKFLVRGYRVEDTELFYDLTAENVANALRALAGKK